MIAIKKCSNEHIPELLAIAIRSYLESYEYLWDDNGAAYVRKFYSKELLEAEISTEGISYFFVYVDDEPVGYFKIKESAMPPGEEKACLEIDKLYFLKEFTGKGIGKPVISFIENLAREQHKRLIWLKVMESSPAISFYEFHGFTEVNRSHLSHPHMKDHYRVLLTFMKRIEVAQATAETGSGI
jgi:GNAT superfamily N-acetyltransferase